MRKFYLGIFLIGIFFFLVLFLNYKRNNGKYFLNEIYQMNYSIEMPISNAKEAVQYLKNLGIIDHSAIEKAESQTELINNWIVYSKKINIKGINEKIWAVEIRSRGVMPSYSCFYSFDKEGNILNRSSDCRWNK